MREIMDSGLYARLVTSVEGWVVVVLSMLTSTVEALIIVMLGCDVDIYIYSTTKKYGSSWSSSASAPSSCTPVPLPASFEVLASCNSHHEAQQSSSRQRDLSLHGRRESSTDDYHHQRSAPTSLISRRQPSQGGSITGDGQGGLLNSPPREELYLAYGADYWHTHYATLPATVAQKAAAHYHFQLIVLDGICYTRETLLRMAHADHASGPSPHRTPPL